MRCQQDQQQSPQLPSIPSDWTITNKRDLPKFFPHIQMLSLQFNQYYLILQFIQSSPYANKTFTYRDNRQTSSTIINDNNEVKQLQQEKLFKTICGQNFSHMTGLYLTGNKINTLQPLTWLNAPILQLLHINDNHITNFKPFIKTLFKQLCYLDTSRNPNMNYQYLHRICMTLNEFDFKIKQMDRQQAKLSSFKNLTPYKELTADTLSNSLLSKLPMKTVHNLVILGDRFHVRVNIMDKLPQYRQSRRIFLGEEEVFAVM